MIQETAGVFVISSGGTWLAGNYETKRAARFAFRLTEAQRYALQEPINKGERRPITWDEVQAAMASRLR